MPGRAAEEPLEHLAPLYPRLYPPGLDGGVRLELRLHPLAPEGVGFEADGVLGAVVVDGAAVFDARLASVDEHLRDRLQLRLPLRELRRAHLGRAERPGPFRPRGKGRLMLRAAIDVEDRLLLGIAADDQVQARRPRKALSRHG